MIYVNCAARHGGIKTAAPMMSPREIDEARSAAASALAEAKHPETGDPLFPGSSPPPRPTRSTRPARVTLTSSPCLTSPTGSAPS